MTYDEFLAGLTLLEVAADVVAGDEQRKVYFSTLRDLEPKAWESAVSRCLAELEFKHIPMPGLLRRYADEADHGLDMTADEAFSVLRSAFATCPADDPQKARQALGVDVWEIVQSIGGWFDCCQSEDRGTLFAQFRDAWNSRVRRQQAQRRLPGGLKPRLNPAHAALLERPAETLLRIESQAEL